MATEAQIIAIQAYLPTDAAEKYSFDEDTIGALYDSLGSVAKVMRTFWAKVVADTARYVDVNESGSVRSLSTVHTHAVEQLTYWDKFVDREDRQTNNLPIGFGRISISRAVT